MRSLVLLLCLLLAGCGGAAVSRSVDVPSFAGIWSGTWNLSPNESGTVTEGLIRVANGNPGFVIDHMTLVNTAGPSNAELHCGFDIVGVPFNGAGTYRLGTDPSIDVTGGQLTLSQDANTITGTVEIGHNADITLNLTRVP